VCVRFDYLMTMSVSEVIEALVRYSQMGMMHLRDDADKGKLKYSEKNIHLCHLIHHKGSKDWPGMELCPLH